MMTGGTQSGEQPDTQDWAMKPWPMHPLPALVLSLIMPWQACRGAWQKNNVWVSLIYHALGVFGFIVGLVVVDQVLWWGDILSEFMTAEPAEFAILLLFVGVWAITIELSYMLVALLTSCWGAGVERFRDSYGRSLSRWYQLTPFHATWTLGFLVVIELVDEMRRHFYDFSSINYEVSALISSAMQLLVFLIYFGLGGWFTLRALAVPRSNAAYYPQCRWPAACETCGYAIVGISREHGCPECGRPIESSLETSRGRTTHNTLAKMAMALFMPGKLGEIEQTRVRGSGPAKALTVAALTLLLTGPIGIAEIGVIVQIINNDFGFDSFAEFINIFFIAGLGMGLSAMMVGVFIVLFVGSLVGLVDRIFGKRNALPTACRAACYASGYTVVLAHAMYIIVALSIVVVEYYFNQFGYGVFAIIPLVWLAILLFLTLPYFWIVGRIERRMRYANT